MFEATMRAFGQMRDRAFRSVIFASILWTLVAFALLGAGAFLLAGQLFGPHFVGWIGVVLVGFATAGALWLLFVPVAAGIATFYTDRIADSVERRWYPALPPVTPASLAAQLWDGVAVFLRLAAAQLLLAIVLHTGMIFFLPGVAAVLWLGLAGWAYARGVFVTLAMRRLPRDQALAAWDARRLTAVGVGVLVALAAFVPVLNLLAPILGVAALVHVLQNNHNIKATFAQWGDSSSTRVLPRPRD